MSRIWSAIEALDFHEEAQETLVNEYCYNSFGYEVVNYGCLVDLVISKVLACYLCIDN